MYVAGNAMQAGAASIPNSRAFFTPALPFKGYNEKGNGSSVGSKGVKSIPEYEYFSVVLGANLYGIFEMIYFW